MENTTRNQATIIDSAQTGMQKRPLGRGLSALLGDQQEDLASLDRVRYVKMVSTEKLVQGSVQPRLEFDEEMLQSLAKSIKDKGVLQPIVVRRSKVAPSKFEIIAGERRWRASKMIGMQEVPVIIKELDDKSALEIALIENIQREELKPLEEAEGFKRLMSEYEYSQEEVAEVIGKSRSHIANTIRLLSLPDGVKEHLRAGQISAGHARTLLGSKNPEKLAAKTIKRGLSVRQLEKMVQKESEPAKAKTAKPANDHTSPEADNIVRLGSSGGAEIARLETDIMNHLGMKTFVRIPQSTDDKGHVVIEYSDFQELDDLVQLLTGRAAKQSPRNS